MNIEITDGINFSRLQYVCEVWASYNFPNKKPYQPLLGVSEEVGELCHAHLKQEQGIRNISDFQNDKVDAVGDIIIYLADYCNQNKINMQLAVVETARKVFKRDWKKYKKDGISE